METYVCSYGWEHELIRLPDGTHGDHNPSPDHEPCPDIWPWPPLRDDETYADRPDRQECDRDDLVLIAGTTPTEYVRWRTPGSTRPERPPGPGDVEISDADRRQHKHRFWTDDRVEAMERVARLHCGEIVGKAKHHLFTLPSRQQLLGDLEGIDRLFPPENYGPSEELVDFLGDTVWWEEPSPPQRYLTEIYIARRPTVSLTPKGKAALVEGLNYRPEFERIKERIYAREERERYQSSSGSLSVHPDYARDYGDYSSPYRDGDGIDVERGVDFPGDKYELLEHRFGVGLIAADLRVVMGVPADVCIPYHETPHGRVDYYLKTSSGLDGAFEVVTDHNDRDLHRQTYEKTAALYDDDIARTIYLFSSRKAAGKFFDACYEAGYLEDPIPRTLGLDRMNKRVVDRYHGTGQNGVYAIETIARKYNDLLEDEDFSLQTAKRLAF